MGRYKLTKEQYIENANKMFNNFYSYEKVEYFGKNNPIIITCPVHGDFYMTAKIHLVNSNGKSGHCPLCYPRRTNNRSKPEVKMYYDIDRGSKYDCFIGYFETPEIYDEDDDEE